MNEIDSLMGPMFTEAEEKGLWFFSSYQQIWFSPRELRTYQANGRFRWGPVNWQLRDPKELVEEASARVVAAQKEHDATVLRVQSEAALERTR